MKTFRHIFAFFVLLAAGVFAFAAPNAAPSSADVTHLHVQLVVPASNLKPGETAKGGLYFKLEPGWHVYWKNAGDAGEPPHIKWTLPDGITAGPLEFPVPQRLPVSTLMDYGYEGEVLYPFEIKTAAGAKAGDAILHAKVDWLVCREECIPGKAELEAVRTVGPGGSSVDPDASLFTRLGNKLPKPLPASAKANFQPTATGYRLTLETGKRETEAAFFPADQDVIDNPSPQKVTPTAKGLTLDLKKDASFATNPAQLRGVITLAGGRSYEIAASAGVVGADSAAAPVTAQQPAPASATVPVAAQQAAPAAPQTQMVFTGRPGSVPPPQQRGLAETIGLAFLGGLILNLMPCVFPVLFLKGLGLVQSSSEERGKLRLHGAVYTLGIVVSFWVLVAALLALRAAGSRLGWGFQFQSPIFLLLMASLLFFLGLSLAGQFEIGLTLTSTGGSLAQKQGYTGSFFTGVLAVIVATPCTAPFMGAAIGYAIAAPALVTFAIFTALALGLAAPYVALTLQPAWTRLLPKPGVWMEYLKQAVSVPIFATVIWLAWVVAGSYGAVLLAALLACFLLLAIAGWFLGRWPAKMWSTGVAACFGLGVVLLSIYGANNFSEVKLDTNTTAVVRNNLYISPLWQPWSEDTVQKNLSAGRPVFVDFTASWCLSCQVNERVALSRPEVQKAFADSNVALLRADWTQHDEAIAQALEKLGRSGVPAYALYTPGQSVPKLLPEALTPGIVLDFLNGLPKTSASARK
ncbi:protein-disulfide reductase DsbD family protein [Terracidiphilus gabretensis]|uniref:protein-disulfide reductase DsbD family protein n=1 Tax=Terracidiphilus gabretensis TaxID=1577687 RepID=UPI00071B5F6F|nr:thioredoxin family protein [Terracidiphilus gabretensis]